MILTEKDYVLKYAGEKGLKYWTSNSSVHPFCYRMLGIVELNELEPKSGQYRIKPRTNQFQRYIDSFFFSHDYKNTPIVEPYVQDDGTKWYQCVTIKDESNINLHRIHILGATGNMYYYKHFIDMEVLMDHIDTIQQLGIITVDLYNFYLCSVR
jgi:hypothetical protein